MFVVLAALVWISVLSVSYIIGVVSGFVWSCMFLGVVWWPVLSNYGVVVFSVVGVLVGDGFLADAINVQKLW